MEKFKGKILQVIGRSKEVNQEYLMLQN